MGIFLMILIFIFLFVLWCILRVSSMSDDDKK